MGTRGLRDVGMSGLGDMATHFYHLFNFSSYFKKSSSFDRNCVVPRFYVLRFYNVVNICILLLYYYQVTQWSNLGKTRE